jgi:hypothetical protein
VFQYVYVWDSDKVVEIVTRGDRAELRDSERESALC